MITNNKMKPATPNVVMPKTPGMQKLSKTDAVKKIKELNRKAQIAEQIKVMDGEELAAYEAFKKAQGKPVIEKVEKKEEVAEAKPKKKSPRD